MKIWVLTVMYLQNKLEYLCAQIDKRTDAIAMDLVSETQQVFNRIIEQNELKRKVVNLKVLGDRMKERLGENEAQMLCDFLRSRSLSSMAIEQGVARSTVCRKFNKILKVLSRVCVNLGFDENRFVSEYASLPLVEFARKRIQKIIKRGNEIEFNNKLDLSLTSAYTEISG